jgi:hypothetical protein
MQPKAAREAPQCELEDHQVESEQPMRYAWSRFEVAQARNLALAAGRTVAEASQSPSSGVRRRVWRINSANHGLA